MTTTSEAKTSSATDQDDVLVVEGLRKSFGSVQAVREGSSAYAMNRQSPPM